MLNAALRTVTVSLTKPDFAEICSSAGSTTLFSLVVEMIISFLFPFTRNML